MIEAKLPASLAKTLGELKQSGWKSQSVKEEIRKKEIELDEMIKFLMKG